MDLKYIYFVIQMLSSKDVNFMGYTYKNFDIVNGHDVPGVGMVFFSYFESINYAYLIYFHINLTLVIHQWLPFNNDCFYLEEINHV